MKIKIKHLKILRWIELGHRPAYIAKRLGIARSTMFDYTVFLSKHGYIVRDKNVGWAITEKAHGVLENLPNSDNEIKSRSHYYTFSYGLKDGLSSKEPSRLISMAGIGIYHINKLNGHEDALFTYAGIYCKLTTSNLIIYIPHIKASFPNSEIDLEIESVRLINPIAEALEAKIRKICHSFKLKRPDNNTLAPAISTRHLAIVNDILALKIKSSGKKFSIKDIEDGKERVWVDNSTGTPELEFGHARKGYEDFSKYTEFIEDVIDGKWTQLKNRVDELEKRAIANSSGSQSEPLHDLHASTTNKQTA
jgi:hypothetical protein